jgi:hypothetical protein
MVRTMKPPQEPDPVVRHMPEIHPDIEEDKNEDRPL